MILPQTKLVIIGALSILLVVIAFVGIVVMGTVKNRIIPPLSLHDADSNDAQEVLAGAPLPQNTLLPILPPESTPTLQAEPLPPFPALPPEEVVSPTPNQIPESLDFSNLYESFLGESSFVPPREDELLKIPQVPLAELTTHNDGFQNLADFTVHVAAKAKDMAFSYDRFKDVPKDKNGITLMPLPLVERALAENNFAQFKTAIPILIDFMNAKQAFYKSINVSPSIAEFNRKIISFDTLTLDLLKKAQGAADGTVPMAEVSDFFTKYKNTAFTTQNELASTFPELSVTPARPSVFKKFAHMLGLAEIAHAVLPIMGGIIVGPIPCTCDPSGYGITVTAPVPVIGAGLYVSHAQAASVPIAGITPGAWIKGIYATAPIPCFQVAAPVCIPAPIFSGTPINGLVGTAF